MEAAGGELFLLLNSDAWPVGDAIERLAAFAARAAARGDRRAAAANPDGSLQRSVRGWPTPWRLATEYLFLRRLGRNTRAFNAFYGAGFDHESEREVEVVKGAVMLVRREAYEATGGFDPDFFMYGEEMDLCYRAGRAGWEVVFDPEARSSCTSAASRRAPAGATGRSSGPCAESSSAATCASSPSTRARGAPSGRGGCSRRRSAYARSSSAARRGRAYRRRRRLASLRERRPSCSPAAAS